MPASLTATAAISAVAAVAAPSSLAAQPPSAVAATPAASATTHAATPDEGAPPPTTSEGRDAVHAYLEPGVAAGVATGLYGAMELDGGYRLGDSPLWLHGRVAHGQFATFIDRVLGSDLTEARLGLEARTCTDNDIACFVAGVDFAYRHEMLSTDEGDEDPHTVDVTFAAAIARLGLDLGTKHVRFRPSVELGVRQGGWSNLGLTTGLAFAW